MTGRPLTRCLTASRSIGTPVKCGALQPSALILPQADLTMDEVRKLLTDEGLIPG